MQWQLASETDGAHVQLCSDRACTREIAAFDSDGGRGVVANDLPSGVLFWRAYGRANGITGILSTPTWQLTIGARTAPIDTSWGTTFDVNGDGYADVLVGAPIGEAAYIYAGGVMGLASSPSSILLSPGASNFGSTVSSAGDVNGDGYADFMIAAIGQSGDPGWVYLYLGNAGTIASSPAVTLTDPEGVGNLFGHSISSAGDVNGDGYGDVIVGAPQAANRSGRVYLYLGGATALGTTPVAALSGPDGVSGRFGHALTSAGDVNGDGYADVIVGADGVDAYTGRAYLYMGSASGLASSPTVTLLGPDSINGYFGISVACANDVNGDGYADVWVGANGVDNYTGRAYLYLGGPTGLASSPAIALTGPDGAVGLFGTSLGAGDVNGDGYADIAIGAYHAGDNIGRAYVYSGGVDGLALAPQVALTGLIANGRFGISVAAVGDVDGDGYGDIAVGADGDGNASGWVYVFGGSSSGLSSQPVFTLTGPDTFAGFGAAVASAASTKNRHSCRSYWSRHGPQEKTEARQGTKRQIVGDERPG